MSIFAFVSFLSSKLLSRISQFSLIRIKRYTAKVYRKFELNILRNETARPRSQFLHSCVCEIFIYSHERSENVVQQNRRTDRGINKCRNWERGRAVSFLGIFVLNFLYSVRYPFNQREVSLILPRQRLSQQYKINI
jgi:hypothetical protein